MYAELPLYQALTLLMKYRREMRDEPQFVDTIRLALQHVEDEIERLVLCHSPVNAVFGTGTYLDYSQSDENKLVFDTAIVDDRRDGTTGWKMIQVTVAMGFGALIVRGTSNQAQKEMVAKAFNEMLHTVVEYQLKRRRA